MKKLLSGAAFLTALLTLLPLIAACGSQAPGAHGSGTVQAESAPAETEPAETTLYVEDDLPASLDFGGRTVTTFGWTGSVYDEFAVEEQNGEIVNDAIYTRNLNVSERLNVDLAYVLEPGAYDDRNTWASKVSKSVMAGDAAYDIASGYSMAGASLAADGMLLDLNGVGYIDFSKPWWPDSLNSEASVGGRLYFASGDISTRMIYYMYAVFFNKELAKSFNIPDLYDEVMAGNWTTDLMMTVADGVYDDLNGDGAKDEEDRFGLVCHTTYSDALYFSCGLATTSHDGDGLPCISEDFSGERAQTLLGKLITLFADNDAYLQGYGTNGDGYDRAIRIFTGNRAVFTVTETGGSIRYFRDADLSYGILPMPKGSESQDGYNTCLSFPYSLYGVPLDAADPDVSGAVMECLASEAYRTVSPALFEVALKIKYAEDEEASAMYDIIRESISFDFGRIYNNSLSAITYSLFRDALLNGNTDWASAYAKKEGELTSKLNTLIDSLTAER